MSRRARTCLRTVFFLNSPLNHDLLSALSPAAPAGVRVPVFCRCDKFALP